MIKACITGATISYLVHKKELELSLIAEGLFIKPTSQSAVYLKIELSKRKIKPLLARGTAHIFVEN